MQKSACNRLTRSLLPHLHGFVAQRNELFISPIGNVLRGFLFESMPYSSESFFFWWFLFPVCRPCDYIPLSTGGRLNVPGGTEEWRTDMQELSEKLLMVLEADALPLLRSINSNQDMIDALYVLRGTHSPGRRARQVSDIHVQNDIACLQILDGQFQEAIVMLDSVIAHGHGDDNRQWVMDTVERTKALRSKLLECPELAVAQVREWQDHTLRSLRVEKWR